MIMTDEAEWTPWLPPGKYYAGMTDDYEVYFSPAGAVWHRRRENRECAK